MAETPPAEEWPLLPTETDIYITPDGQVIFADLPQELAALAAELGTVQTCSLELRSVHSDGRD